MTTSVRVVVLALAGVLAQPGGAIQIRSYVPARHDRFTGFPAAPVWNDAAWFESRSFTGIGWAPGDDPVKRQFALVSPQHIVCATHFKPNVGQTVRFLNRAGVAVDRTVAVQTPIKNDLNQDSDLTVVTLSSPILAADRVAHFPYLNLTDEADYAGSELTVFGWYAKAGRGVLAGIDDIQGDGINKTRAFVFNYVEDSGQPDDVYLESKDSGSPTFALAGTRPVLVGIHSAIGGLPPELRENYDTFIPHYISQLNEAMAASGYQMTAAFQPATPLTVQMTPSPALWRQFQEGSCVFTVTHSGTGDATNLALELRFPPGSMPTSLSAPGWLVSDGVAGEKLLRRATLAANATASITATWNDLGTAEGIAIEMATSADGSARRVHDFSQNVATSYAAWSAGLAAPAPAADPDGDGLANLLEYAFGGDPALPGMTQPGGVPLTPQFTVQGGVAVLAFPVRNDMAVRGLQYKVEFSETLADGAWTAEPPPGLVVVDAPFAPPVAGFLRRTVSFPATLPKRFCRVRVEINEAAVLP